MQHWRYMMLYVAPFSLFTCSNLIQFEFELWFTFVLIWAWPQSLMHSHQLSCALKEFELSSTLALV